MHIQRNGSQPSVQGSKEWFTGNVRIDAPFQLEAPARAGGALVTFEPGSRSNWHRHPLGQILIVVAGLGWHQCEGEPKEEIRSGDVVICPPGKRHWHGATSTSAMSHIAIAERDEFGKSVEWMELVGDAQYLGR